ncbi:glycosyltransferase family 2 protein [Funiculus sociatus GB2-A5]|uniref:Glycosyltransferase family 2 protein n=1 Tax=Funiculus sociatus GB2-A5 TaxID=2933946 RepID=A0ABV0JQK7_9CYAN|nr:MULTISPECIES: glycosyltransferase family A protein [unclassified Trichocoleus]MBD1906687.1 glycosyltransferase family 2 protein [Trichocoleus sp. FACHB-832]MBD2063124.1 glycosyltransferase family 2 protein [Trichocoleus sp. FACHB-6]
MGEQEQQRIEPEQNYQYVFTAFTPTYNRAYTLHRVYESLKAQTYRDFEWLIVDDGSTDNTCELVEQWHKEADFPIRYLYQENSGKYIAWNRGVQEARGKLFLCFDSDDACVPEALERLKYHWDSIPEPRKSIFSSVVCLCEERNGKLIGTRFPQEITDSDYLEIHYKFKVKGDKWGFDKTEILSRFPFPVLKGEKLIGESLVWNAIARNNFKTRFVNEVLKIVEYLPDGLTRTTVGSKHALGTAFAHASSLNEDIGWFRYAPLTFFRSAVHYSRFSFHVGVTILKQFEGIKTRLGKILWFVALPLGYLVYIKDWFLKERHEKHF